MSGPIFSSESSAGRANEAGGTYPTKPLQLAVVREMIASLGTLTSAGQRYIMGKILALLRGQVSPGSRAAASRNRQVLSDLVDRLGEEAARLCPDVTGFSRRAESLVVLLAAVA